MGSFKMTIMIKKRKRGSKESTISKNISEIWKTKWASNIHKSSIPKTLQLKVVLSQKIGIQFGHKSSQQLKQLSNRNEEDLSAIQKL